MVAEAIGWYSSIIRRDVEDSGAVIGVLADGIFESRSLIAEDGRDGAVGGDAGIEDLKALRELIGALCKFEESGWILEVG